MKFDLGDEVIVIATSRIGVVVEVIAKRTISSYGARAVDTPAMYSVRFYDIGLGNYQVVPFFETELT